MMGAASITDHSPLPCAPLEDPGLAIALVVGMVAATILFQGILQHTVYIGWKEWYDARGFWPPASTSGWIFFVVWIIVVYPTQIAARVVSLQAQCSGAGEGLLILYLVDRLFNTSLQGAGAGLLILYLVDSLLNNGWCVMLFWARNAHASIPILITNLVINIIIAGVVSSDSTAAVILLLPTIVWLYIACILNVEAVCIASPDAEVIGYAKPERNG